MEIPRVKALSRKQHDWWTINSSVFTSRMKAGSEHEQIMNDLVYHVKKLGLYPVFRGRAMAQSVFIYLFNPAAV